MRTSTAVQEREKQAAAPGAPCGPEDKARHLTAQRRAEHEVALGTTKTFLPLFCPEMVILFLFFKLCDFIHTI